MKKRFILSTAGIAGAAVAAPALAEDIAITLHLDYWAGEHGMSFSSGSGGVSSYVANGYIYAVSSGSVIITGTSLTSWTSGVSPYTSGYRFAIYASVSHAGDYHVRLTDSYGDGWQWNNVTGADAFAVTGNVSGDTVIAFGSGSSRIGTVTIPMPAPGALALLGLAGIVRRRPRH